MWTCRDCGRTFAQRNQWHACTRLGLEEHLAEHGDHAAALYRQVAAAVAACGDHRVHPQATRIAFVATMTFASVQLRRRWADLSFVTPVPVDDDRVHALAMFGPTSFASTVRLADPSDVDADVVRWLCSAHRRGLRETLDPHADVEPLVGRPLALARVPLATRVLAVGPFVARVPTWAAQALHEAPALTARVAGTTWPAHLVATRDGPGVQFDADDLGIAPGDRVDVHLRAAT